MQHTSFIASFHSYVGSGSLLRAGMVAASSLFACSSLVSDQGFDSSTSDALTAAYRINNGGSAVSPFSRDQYVSGGGTLRTYRNVSVSGVANARTRLPAPIASIKAGCVPPTDVAWT